MKNPEKQAELWAKRNPNASRPSWYAQTRPPSCLLEVSGEPEERATQSEIKFGTQTEHWMHNPLEFQDQTDSQNEDPFEVQLEDPTEPQLKNPIKLQVEDLAGPQLDPLGSQDETLAGRDDGVFAILHLLPPFHLNHQAIRHQQTEFCRNPREVPL